MLNRDQAVALIQSLYEARVRGDKAAVAGFWADDAHFEIAGHHSHAGDLSLRASSPMDAIAPLIDRFAFSDLERLETVVEGNKIVVMWRVTVAIEGKPPVTTRLCDIFTIDNDGKIKSLVQFVDTALMRELIG